MLKTGRTIFGVRIASAIKWRVTGDTVIKTTFFAIAVEVRLWIGILHLLLGTHGEIFVDVHRKSKR